MSNMEMLSDVAEGFRTQALEALHTPDISEQIGAKKSKRLCSLAMRAGVILLNGDKSEIRKSSNRLYIIPTHDQMPENGTLTLRRRRKSIDVGLRDFKPDLGFAHVGFYGNTKMDVIVVPVGDYLDIPEAEQAATGVHEFTHADQYRRKTHRDGAIKEEKRVAARDEAEAYTNQFHVMNHYWDGALRDVLAENVGLASLNTVRVADESLGNRLISSAAAQAGLYAVARNITYGYIPDGLTLPGPELAEEYAQAGLLAASGY